jgi:hypothetical protein
MLLSNSSKSLIYYVREVNSYMADTSISQIAYILALIGGILLVIFGLISLIGSSFGPSFLYWGWGFASFALGGGIISIICGVIAIIGARSASTLVWAIVLIIVGIIGGGLGGLLVILGGLLGLIVVITKKA